MTRKDSDYNNEELDYTHGMLDILGILDESSIEIEGKVAPEKQFEDLKTAIHTALGHIYALHNDKVREHIGLHIIVPNRGTTEKSTIIIACKKVEA